MNDEGYNGWRNYPTWNVALWLDNDEGTYTDVRERIAELGDDRADVADMLREYVDELVDAIAPGITDGASFVADIFGWALDSVDWRELADNYISEMSEA